MLTQLLADLKAVRIEVDTQGSEEVRRMTMDERMTEAQRKTREARLKILGDALEVMKMPREDGDRVRSLFCSAILKTSWGIRWENATKAFQSATSSAQILKLLRFRDHNRNRDDYRKQQIAAKCAVEGFGAENKLREEPSDVVSDAELVELFFQELSTTDSKLHLRVILGLRLNDFSIDEIAELSRVSTRTIERRTKIINQYLSNSLPRASRVNDDGKCNSNAIQRLQGSELQLLAVVALSAMPLTTSEIASFLGLPVDDVERLYMRE